MSRGKCTHQQPFVFFCLHLIWSIPKWTGYECKQMKALDNTIISARINSDKQCKARTNNTNQVLLLTTILHEKQNRKAKMQSNKNSTSIACMIHKYEGEFTLKLPAPPLNLNSVIHQANGCMRICSMHHS